VYDERTEIGEPCGLCGCCAVCGESGAFFLHSTAGTAGVLRTCGGTEWRLLPVAAHLILFPVVAALPAPPWARAAGYGWLVIDITTDVMALQGVADTLYLPMRYGGHVSAAVWIAAASWQAKGATRIVGLLLALILGGYSLIPHGPLGILILSWPLLPLWFALIRYVLARSVEHQH